MCIRNCCNGSQCSRCGECCALAIPITRKEENRIRKYIQENQITPESLFDKDNFYCKCCFYDRKNRVCKIYPVRPNICKSYKCNRDNAALEKEKLANHDRAYWNHIGKDGKLRHATSFDLLFYDDPVPLLTLLSNEFKDENGNLTLENFYKMKDALRTMDLGDLADALHEE